MCSSIISYTAIQYRISTNFGGSNIWCLAKKCVWQDFILAKKGIGTIKPGACRPYSLAWEVAVCLCVHSAPHAFGHVKFRLNNWLNKFCCFSALLYATCYRYFDGHDPVA